ncbi:MAG TPA: MinD/ParA family protein [Clostridiales bacterium]|nr:MinD/ParA family protein [Clostridiales bacterium]
MDQAERLREIVKANNVPKMSARVITVTSGKGGVGKSSISLNLAIALTHEGYRVVIIDGDFGLANVEVMLGIHPTYNLSDLIYRNKSVSEIITKGPEGIGFISGGSGIQEMNELTKYQIMYMIQNLAELDELADIILIDTGAGISNSVLEFVAASTEVLLVTTPEPTSITDAYALLKTLNRKSDFDIKDITIRMISNRVSSEEEGSDLYRKLNTVVDRFLHLEMDYLGAVMQESNVSKAVMHQKPAIMLYPNIQFSKKIKTFAKILCEKDDIKGENRRGIAQLFSRLLLSKNKKN